MDYLMRLEKQHKQYNTLKATLKMTKTEIAWSTFIHVAVISFAAYTVTFAVCRIFKVGSL